MSDSLRFDQGTFEQLGGFGDTSGFHADVIVKTSEPISEKITVLRTRRGFVYPGYVPEWKDIRLGVFVSTTRAVGDDDPSELQETLVTPGDGSDRLWLGFKARALPGLGDLLPPAAEFFGITNAPLVETTGSSVMETIDTNTRWRAKYATSQVGLALCDAFGSTVNTAMQPFRTIQNPAALAGPATGGEPPTATLVLLRMTRAAVGSVVDKFYVAKSSFGGVDYADSGVETANPQIPDVLSKLASATWTEAFTAHDFPGMPNGFDGTFYAYWPFENSRLRIHTIVLQKFA